MDKRAENFTPPALSTSSSSSSSSSSSLYLTSSHTSCYPSSSTDDAEFSPPRPRDDEEFARPHLPPKFRTQVQTSSSSDGLPQQDIPPHHSEVLVAVFPIRRPSEGVDNEISASQEDLFGSQRLPPLVVGDDSQEFPLSCVAKPATPMFRSTPAVPEAVEGIPPAESLHLSRDSQPNSQVPNVKNLSFLSPASLISHSTSAYPDTTKKLTFSSSSTSSGEDVNKPESSQSQVIAASPEEGPVLLQIPDWVRQETAKLKTLPGGDVSVTSCSDSSSYSSPCSINSSSDLSSPSFMPKSQHIQNYGAVALGVAGGLRTDQALPSEDAPSAVAQGTIVTSGLSEDDKALVVQKSKNSGIGKGQSQAHERGASLVMSDDIFHPSLSESEFNAGSGAALSEQHADVVTESSQQPLCIELSQDFSQASSAHVTPRVCLDTVASASKSDIGNAGIQSIDKREHAGQTAGDVSEEFSGKWLLMKTGGVKRKRGGSPLPENSSKRECAQPIDDENLKPELAQKRDVESVLADPEHERMDPVGAPLVLSKADSESLSSTPFNFSWPKALAEDAVSRPAPVHGLGEVVTQGKGNAGLSGQGQQHPTFDHIEPASEIAKIQPGLVAESPSKQSKPITSKTKEMFMRLGQAQKRKSEPAASTTAAPESKKFSTGRNKRLTREEIATVKSIVKRVGITRFIQLTMAVNSGAEVLTEMDDSDSEPLQPSVTSTLLDDREEPVGSVAEATPVLQSTSLQRNLESSPELEVGAVVFARWADNKFYPGIIKDVDEKLRVTVYFDDGARGSAHAGDVVLRRQLCRGQPVEVRRADGFYVPARVTASSRDEEGKDIYVVELDDGGGLLQVDRSRICLTMDQARNVLSHSSSDLSEGAPSTAATRVVVKKTSKARARRRAVAATVDSSTSAGEAVEKPRFRRRTTSEVPSSCAAGTAAGTSAGTASATVSTAGLNVAVVSSKGHPSACSATTSVSTSVAAVATSTVGRNLTVVSTKGPADVSMLFKGMFFLITSSSAQPSQSQSLQRSAESESDDEQVVHSFDKNSLKSMISSHGGKVIARLSQRELSRAGQRGELVLLSDRHQQTVKYMYCLVRGIPCLYADWVDRSIELRCRQPFQEWLLIAGKTLTRDVVEQSIRPGRAPHTPLLPYRIYLHEDERKVRQTQEWTLLLSAAGADRCFAGMRFRPHQDLVREFADVNVIIVLSPKLPDEIYLAATCNKIPVATPHWLYQCLLNNVMFDFDISPSFLYRHVS